MLIGCVVWHQIENDLQIARMRRSNQRIEIIQRAEYRIDSQIVGDVIAKVGHRRRKDRRQPNRIDAEIAEIEHMIDDSGQIADSVAIRVLKRPWVNLIENSALPPGNRCVIHVDNPPRMFRASVPRQGRAPFSLRQRQIFESERY